MQVSTHGNRHRLTITATGKDGYEYSLDTGKAGKHEDEDWVVLCSNGFPIGHHWDIIAGLMVKAFNAGLIQPRHAYRVPAWELMPFDFQQAVFSRFHPCQ